MAEGQFLIYGLTWNTEECRRFWAGCLQKPKIISIPKTEAAAIFSPSLEADDSSKKVTKSIVLYLILKFVTAFTITRDFSLYGERPIQYTSSHSIYLTYLSSLRLGFLTKARRNFFLPQGCSTPRQSHISSFHHQSNFLTRSTNKAF
jgi:hypothetical protein